MGVFSFPFTVLCPLGNHQNSEGQWFSLFLVVNQKRAVMEGGASTFMEMSTFSSRNQELTSFTLLSRIINDNFWDIVFLSNPCLSSQYKLSGIWTAWIVLN